MEIELRRATGLLDYLGRQAWLSGEEIIITKKGKPYLKLTAHPEGNPSEKERQPQRPVSVEGKIWISPEFFEEDMEIIEAFEGKYSDDSLFEPFLIKPDSGEEQPNDSSSPSGTDK